MSIEDGESLREILLRRVKSIDFSKVRRELAPFLEDPGEIRLMEKRHLLEAVSDLSVESIPPS